MAKKKRGGGPKTAAGKLRSSQNAVRHGVRAAQIRLLPNETEGEYEAVAAKWRKQFPPDDFQTEKLVDTLILNDWLHRRAQRWQTEVEASLVEADGPDPMHWSDEHRHKLELAQRYRGTAERAFYRSFNMLRELRREKRREEQEDRKSGHRTPCAPPKVWVVVEDPGPIPQESSGEKTEQPTSNQEVMSKSDYEIRRRELFNRRE
jgi:hypothetical protein